MGRRDGQVGLLNFKEADGETWIDSKEGGVYAYLVVPTPEWDPELEDNLERCMVETFVTLDHAHLVSSSGHPDPYSAENDYWPDLYARGPDNNQFNILRYKNPVPSAKRVEGKTPEEIRNLVTNHIKAYEGGPFYAAVYLGSSGPSVYENDQEFPKDITEPYTFWPIYTRNDLNEEGQQLYDTLKKLYETEPVILLFLDT